MSKHDGKTYGGYFVHSAYAVTLASGSPKLMADVECVRCGTRFTRSISAVKNNAGGCQTCVRKAAKETPPPSKHPLYNTWLGIHARCKNPKSQRFSDYGGRGITVCERWESFSAFVDDMGDRPSSGHSVDRIDVNGHYEPSNCRWATQLEQANNRRNTVWLEFQGEKLSLTQWARRFGVVSNLRRVAKKYNRTLESVICAFVSAVEAGARTKPAAALGITRVTQTKDEALAKERRRAAEQTAARNAQRAARVYKHLKMDVFDPGFFEGDELDELLSDFGAMLFDEDQ